MITRYRIGVGLLAVLATTAWLRTAWAQDAMGVRTTKTFGVDVPEPTNSGVEAILATDPSTPPEWARAAKILADLQRPDLAKKFLKKIADAKLDQKQLAALEAQFGSGIFVSMAARAELLPEGKQVGDAILAAAERELSDPQRLAGLVKQLSDPSIDVRYRAMDGLRRARGAAIGRLVSVLADASRAAEYVNVRAMLVRLGRDAVEPLVASLQATDPKLLVQVMQVLVDLNVREAVVALLAPCAAAGSDPAVRRAAAETLTKLVGTAPGEADAARLLSRRAGEYFEQLQSLATDMDGRVAIWTWDPALKQPVSKPYLPADASRLLAARLARDAYAVSPTDPAVRRLYLATMLEKAAYDNGLGKPLPVEAGTPAALAAAFDVQVIEDLLRWAMETNHSPAATAAATILGTKGTAEALLNEGSEPAPLVRATRNPDRRLRFAAVEAILKLKPASPFPGSNQVAEALGYFISTSGSRRALVADPVREEALRIGGLFTGLGYQVDTAVTGPELVRQAISSPDYEIALVSASLGESTVETLQQQLRFDSRTAWLPIGVLGRLGQAELARHLVGQDRLSVAFVRPHVAEDARWQAQQLMDRLGPQMVPYAERQAQAAQSLVWLGELSAQRQTVFDVHRLEPIVLAAQKAPTLAIQAGAVLGNLGTAKGQLALVEEASQRELPLAVRKAAVSALCESIEKHGVLLTSPQIVRQYDRYNQSAGLDAPTQQILGLILDYLESRATPRQDQDSKGLKLKDERGKAEGGKREPKAQGGGGKA